MKNKKNNLIAILRVLVFLELFLQITPYIIQGSIEIKTENLNEISSKFSVISNPLGSAIHIPIEIDGNTELLDFIQNNGLSGNGNTNDPYIIENYTISVVGAPAIVITNTDKFIKIQNCTLNSSILETNIGIQLSGTENIIIHNNSFIDFKVGINTTDTINVNVSQSNFFRNERAVRMRSSSDIIIRNCNFKNCTIVGIRLYRSNELQIFDNVFTEKSPAAIRLEDSNESQVFRNFIDIGNSLVSGDTIDISGGQKNSIFNNSITNNRAGIRLCETNYSILENNWINSCYLSGIVVEDSFNCIINKNIIQNIDNYGLAIVTSNNSIISQNIIENEGISGLVLFYINCSSIIGNTIDNSSTGCMFTHLNNSQIIRNNFTNNDYGVNLTEANTNNLFYLNNFISNNRSIINSSDSINNVWDNGTHGNYWDDYQMKYPSASNNEILWNTPYEINENECSAVDHFPLVEIVTDNSLLILNTTESSEPEEEEDDDNTHSSTTTTTETSNTETSSTENNIPWQLPSFMGITVIAILGIVISYNNRRLS
ncbi:nitrous oxide reductase family maturation protein NosD [Candidatus Lokiarchaeum ossiferum]|uniref:nitrous oxide reductase family maturation protein NosD n=1 Tax=Candidatus Lokiarchaeum ossiferum TaxID=2951803 RepID=UPI00352DE702